jgi:hypothetical protein
MPEKRTIENQPDGNFTSNPRKRPQKAGASAAPKEAARPDRAEIEALAYEKYMARGYEDGHADEDWLATEADLTGNQATTNGTV